jgi:hypothetical protein
VQDCATRVLESIDLIYKTDSSICIFTEAVKLWHSFIVPHLNTFYQKGTNHKGLVVIVTPPVGKHIITTKVEVNIENTVIIDIDELSKKKLQSLVSTDPTIRM